ncbi:MAG: ABC transporter permease [Acidiphilium sp.]
MGGKEPPDITKKNLKPLLKSYAPLFALIGVILIFTAADPSFLSSRNLAAIISQASVLLIAATGQTFIILLGSIDLSTEGVMAMSSMIVALLVANSQNHMDLGLWGLLIAIGCGAVFGLANGILYTWAKIPSFMVTLGTWYIGLGIATALFAGQTPIIHSAILLNLTKTAFGLPIVVFVSAACVLLGALLLRWTRFGRYVLAIGGNERLSQLAGLPIRRYKILAFTFAGAMNAVAGVLATAQIGNGSVTVGNEMVFASIASVVVGGTLLSGGRGGVWNTLVGALLLTCVADGMILTNITPNIQQSVQGAIVVIAVASSSWALRRRTRVVK